MLRIDNIKISTKLSDQIDAINKKIEKICNIHNIESLSILKRSIDARKKPDLFYIYSIIFNTDKASAQRLLKNKKLNVTIFEPKTFEYIKINNLPVENRLRPIIVGTGPAGLFCGYSLIMSGLKPIFIERGQDIDNRTKTVMDFWNGAKLNTQSNVQFGEGGAGTFSDGKLNTGVKDPEGFNKEVLSIFVRFGASEEILYSNKPHIGTDVLKDVIKNMRNFMKDNGADFYFNTQLIDFDWDKAGVHRIKVTNKDHEENYFDTRMLILALGHSARDTFLLLKDKGLHMENKAFAVGFRVAHPQTMINNSQYGQGNDNMPSADYKLTYTASSKRGVYSFCMCPGGYVVNASSEDNHTCVNGMSYSDRSANYANSAIVMTINEDDYGKELLDGMRFQRDLEAAVYNKAAGKLVVQKYGDFKKGIPTSMDDKIGDALKGLYVTGDVSDIIKGAMKDDFIEAMEHYGKVIKGFNFDDALIIPIEARTSSPVRILRNEEYVSNIKGIYPIGEGAGYAGGITSAAIDGLKVAKRIALGYNN